MTYANAAERKALINGLRGIAEFLEENPLVPAPESAEVMVFPDYFSPYSRQCEEIDMIALLIGSGTETTRTRGHYVTSRRFGPVEYRAVAIPSNTGEQ